MHGNAWQWVQDWYAHDYGSGQFEVDPSGPFQTYGHVTRGGSYLRWAQDLRSARRTDNPLTWRYSDVGFRLVRTRTRM